MAIERVIDGGPYESPADARERLRAETLLAKMDVFNELLAGERVERAGGLDGRFWEQKTADAFRRAIGVEPSRRELLREGLESIRDLGRGRVADLLADLAAGQDQR